MDEEAWPMMVYERKGAQKMANECKMGATHVIEKDATEKSMLHPRGTRKGTRPCTRYVEPKGEGERD